MAAGPCRRLQLRLLLRGDKLLADIVPFRFAKVRPESFYGRDPFQNTKTLFRNLQNQPFHAKIRRQEDCALLLSISASHTIRERIGAVIRADHAAFSGFRSTFLGHQARNSLVTASRPPTPASVAEARSAQEWLRPGCELRGRSRHRRMRIGKPNA